MVLRGGGEVLGFLPIQTIRNEKDRDWSDSFGTHTEGSAIEKLNSMRGGLLIREE